MKFKVNTNEPFDNVQHILELVQDRIENHKFFVTLHQPEYGFIELREICGLANSITEEGGELFMEVSAVENRNGYFLTEAFNTLQSSGKQAELLLTGMVDPIEVVEVRGAYLNL